jgi:crotonobetainyl-CoA:carnitine CoA-transferase CaiB-like acyl-CoA transferase
MSIQRPLEGIRVLEIASIIVGPLCGQYLGDMGAEVIKLEPPEGDRTRVMGPRRSPRMGSFFMTSNRNKRSIVVNLKTPEGIAILQKLLVSCDVLLHSMRTPAADRLGLNYDSLKLAHPKLIYCHVAGFGDDGNAFEPPIAPMGYEPVSTASRRPYRTKDGFLVLLPYNDSDWQKFFELAGAPEAMNDERFATFQARQKHFRVVWDEVERQIAGKTNEEWLALLAPEDIPFSVVNSLDDLLNDPHLKSVNFWEIHQHPSEGAVRIPRVPVQMSGARTDITRLQPQLGEHSAQILRECGFNADQIDQLTAEGGPCRPAAD